MKIMLWIEDCDSGDVLEKLGECVTDSPNRAKQMYESRCNDWADKGWTPIVCWLDITDKETQND